MAIRKMKFASVTCQKNELDDTLLRILDTDLLDPVSASSIVEMNEDGKLIEEENVYSDYLNGLKVMAHSIGLELKPKKDAKKEYTNKEIDEFIHRFSTQIELSSCGEGVLLTEDDQQALDKLSEFDFTKIHDCSFIQFGLGRLPIESYKKLSYVEDSELEYAILHSNNQYHWILYVASKTNFAKEKKLLDTLFLEEIRIPDIDVKKVKEEFKEELDDIYTYCVKNDNLHRLYEYVVVYDGVDYKISGFIPADQENNYAKAFDGLNVKIKFKDPKEKSKLKCPTLLKNNKFFEPFEMFVDMYSLPDYRDFDPTLFLGITYCLLFGIMFGDLGQGLVFFLIGTYFYDIKHKGKIFGIISRIGFTSMIFGFIFGSFFGNEEILTPLQMMVFHTTGKPIHVMDSSFTMTLLICAAFIGMILILCSMMINMYKNYRRKEIGKLLFSVNGIAGFVFYAYVFVVALSMTALPLDINLLSTPFLIIFVALPFICFFFEEPLENLLEHKPLKPHEGWGGYIVQMFFEIITIILEFVSNTLSFLRVGGFVLSHAGMMIVVSVLMEMTGNASLIVCILGNIFVMGLEGLVVGIQTLRLEYYEMFSRFYDGGGKKYTVLTSNE